MMSTTLPVSTRIFREGGAVDFQCDHQGIVVRHVELYSFVFVEGHDFSFWYYNHEGGDGGIASRFSQRAGSLVESIDFSLCDRLHRFGEIEIDRFDAVRSGWVGSLVALRKLRSVS
ncbi:hypothetical protein Bca4012_087451 [Brassica carinata]